MLFFDIKPHFHIGKDAPALEITIPNNGSLALLIARSS